MVNEQVSQSISEQNLIETVQHNLVDIPPTAAEISHLWSTYMAESMACCFLKHITATTKDPDYHSFFRSALESASKNTILIENIFNSIPHPIPEAFGEKDVNPSAPKLFGETYNVIYTRTMIKYISQNYYLAFTESTRSDVRQLFCEFIDDARDLICKADDILLAKGVYPKPPYIAIPDKVEFVHDKSYYGSLIGEKRALNALEISNIYSILNFKVTIRALKLGFAQVVKSTEIKKFFMDGVKVAENHIITLRSILEEEGLPCPEIMDYHVTNLQDSPFSDRLMLLHTTTVMAYILTAYGTGLSRILRKDIITTYTRLMKDILTISKEGADLLIKNGWLEKIPETINHKALTH